MKSKKNFFNVTGLIVTRKLSVLLSIFLILFKKLLFSLKLKKYFLEFNHRPDDIYISTFMKSGTTWMQMILYQLTSDGNMNFSHIYKVSPFFEMAVSESDKLDHYPSPRFIKTHVPYDIFSRFSKGNGKIIYVIRDGRDVAVSLYHHCIPSFSESEVPTFDSSFHDYFLNIDKIKRWDLDENGWFGHVAGWLANKKQFNILYIKYEDIVTDLEGSIRKISDFCGIKINEADFPRIMERCSFKFMKQHQDKFDARRISSMVFKQKSNDFLRKGKTKDWQNYFCPELIEQYEYLFDKFLADFDLDSYRTDGSGINGLKN